MPEILCKISHIWEGALFTSEYSKADILSVYLMDILKKKTQYQIVHI